MFHNPLILVLQSSGLFPRWCSQAKSSAMTCRSHYPRWVSVFRLLSARTRFHLKTTIPAETPHINFGEATGACRLELQPSGCRTHQRCSVDHQNSNRSGRYHRRHSFRRATRKPEGAPRQQERNSHPRSTSAARPWVQRNAWRKRGARSHCCRGSDQVFCLSESGRQSLMGIKILLEESRRS